MTSHSATESPTPSFRIGRLAGIAKVSKRSRLRNGTFIVPGTGERVRRQITLRESSFDGTSRRFSSDSDHILPLRRTYSQAGTFRTAVDNTTDAVKEFWEWLHTPTAKDILKCSLAYLLGSMATFLPPLASFLGHQDGKHMVATITVYFHPARSMGSMEEAAILGFGAFLYATFIGISSMATSTFFETQLNLIEVGYALVLIVFCGGGLGFVGWFKQRFNAPLVSVACSLASLAIITIITKENAVQVGVFENDKIVQVMKMVIMGIIATSVVSLSLWPKSARTQLRDTMIKATDSFGDMLTMITRSFLSGSETDLRSTSFNDAQNKYKSVFTQLTKNLKEAKFEHYLLGREEEYKLEASLVHCMQRLAQSIGGLRSAATTQFSLLREGAVGTPVVGQRLLPRQAAPITSLARHDRFAVLTAIEEASDEGSGADEQELDEDLPGLFSREGTGFSFGSTMPTVRTPSEIFSRFIIHLGPSMKSLAYTLSQILQELPFGPGPDYEITINDHFKTSLTDALQLYSQARAEALKQLYMSKELDRDRSESVEADFEEVAASCGHFSFSLQAFAHEMQTFLSILEELKEVTEHRDQRSWEWLKFWQTSIALKTRRPSVDPEREGLVEQHEEAQLAKDLPDVALERRETRDMREPADDPLDNLYRKVFQVIRFLERDDIRFAFKVGIGASLYALFAFIPFARPFYQHWRGEWGLLSYMLVCAMTIGASNTTGWSRFIGTVMGAIIAVFVWILCQGNGFALAFCGWLVSLPCFYIIIAKGNGPFGRFIMLTYNLSCLYAYSLSVKDSDDDDDEGGVAPIIGEIALHRVVAVLAGCVWGLIITRVIWPISARQKFKDGLSLLLLRMGLIWKRDPLATLLEGESQNEYMNLREEFAFQRYVIRLDKLRSSATHEFELRGPFPAKVFGRIMDSVNKMLDSFHAMNVVVQKNMNMTEGETALLKCTADERAQLCARISHLFQVLASSIKLEYPLSSTVPSTSNARDRLLAKIFQYRKDLAKTQASTSNPAENNNESSESGVEEAAKDEDYEMLYAYILVTGQLAEEIETCEKIVEELYGVMDEDLLKLQ